MARDWLPSRDRGMTGIGLLMQYMGVVTICGGVLFLEHTAESATSLAGLLTVARGFAHFCVGYLFASERPFIRRSSALLAYGVMALLETTVHVLIARDAVFSLLVDWVHGLAWPACLLLFTALNGRKAIDEAPPSRHRGFASVGMLMSLLGATGLIIVCLLVLTMIGVDDLPAGRSMLHFTLLGLLGARELTHLAIGLRIWATPLRAIARIRQFNGVVLTLDFTALILLASIISVTGPTPAGEKFSDAVILIGCCAVFVVAWPLILARFASQRKGASIASGRTHSTMDVFAWVLIALGVEKICENATLVTWMLEHSSTWQSPETFEFLTAGICATTAGILILRGSRFYRLALFAFAIALVPAYWSHSHKLFPVSPTNLIWSAGHVFYLGISIIGCIVALRDPPRRFHTVAPAKAS